MVDERRPTKKVVKKVVKKTVVVRPARPGATKVAPARPTTTVRTPLAKLKAKASTRTLPSIRIPSPPRRPGAGFAARARLVGSRVGDRARDIGFTAGQNLRRGERWVRDLRLPQLSALRASAITGFVVGVLAVALGWLSYELFSATRGTQAGGGWGALVLVVVAFVTFAAGELLLGGFGVDHARFISSISIMLVLVLILTFFLELAAGRGAWILLPVLGTISFMASSRLLLFAADEPTNHHR
jgi:hypothetical protein